MKPKMKLIDRVKKIVDEYPEASEKEIVKIIADKLNIPKFLASTLYEMVSKK